MNATMNKTVSTLGSFIDTSSKTKFLKENIEELKKPFGSHQKTFTTTTSTEKLKKRHSIYLANQSKNKMKINLTNNKKFLGVEEGLIELPKIKPSLDRWRKLTPEELEIKHLEEIDEMIKLQMSSVQDDTRVFAEEEETVNHYDCIKTGENEIKKLNGWDIVNATNVQLKYQRRTTNNFSKMAEALDSTSLKWFMDIKNNPKSIALLNRNKHLHDFFKKIDEEQKAIFNQSLNINKKQFNFNVFAKGVSETEEDTITKPVGTSIDFYREVMRDKVKVEEFMRNDLSSVAETLYSKKKKKKRIMQEMIDTINELNNNENKRKEVLLNADKYGRKSDFNPETKQEPPTIKKHNSQAQNIINKQLRLVHSNEVTHTIKTLHNERQEINIKIDMLNKDLTIIDEEIRYLKVRINNKINDHRKYNFDILKKGIDVRRDGIVWVVVRLIELKAYIEYSKFPKFLTPDQIEFILLIAYKQHELSELIQLFQVLKKKQKEMRDSHQHEKTSSTNLKLTEPNSHYQKNFKDDSDDKLFSHSNYGSCLNEIYAKYENVINICLNETSEDQYIKSIARELHDKIVKSYTNENSNEGSDTLYFLPGSLAEFFNESNKFRQYFDDIYYLNTQISKKEIEMKEIKKNQMKKFKKESEMRAVRNSIEHEMTFAALFGNGINI